MNPRMILMTTRACLAIGSVVLVAGTWLHAAGQAPADVAGDEERILGVASFETPIVVGPRKDRENPRAQAVETTLGIDRTILVSALEEAILDFPGCVVLISHDRWFLDRIATHILAFEGDSKVTWFEGNYADYEADRKRRLGADADQPHRIKYKRLDS